MLYRHLVRTGVCDVRGCTVGSPGLARARSDDIAGCVCVCVCVQFTVLDQDDTTSADAAAFYAILGVKDIAGTVAAIAACEGAAPAGAALGAA